MTIPHSRPPSKNGEHTNGRLDSLHIFVPDAVSNDKSEYVERLRQSVRSLQSVPDYPAIGNLVIEALMRPGQEESPDEMSQAVDVVMPEVILSAYKIPKDLRYYRPLFDEYLPFEHRTSWTGRFHELLVQAYMIDATIRNLPSPYSEDLRFLRGAADQQESILLTAWLGPKQPPSKPSCCCAYNATWDQVYTCDYCRKYDGPIKEFHRTYRNQIALWRPGDAKWGRDQFTWPLVHGFQERLTARSKAATRRKAEAARLETENAEVRALRDRSTALEGQIGEVKDMLRSLLDREAAVRDGELKLAEERKRWERQRISEQMNAEIEDARKKAARLGDPATNSRVAEALAAAVARIKAKYEGELS